VIHLPSTAADAQPGACLGQLRPGGKHRWEAIKLASRPVIPGTAQPGRCVRHDLLIAGQHGIPARTRYRALPGTSPPAQAGRPAHLADRGQYPPHEGKGAPLRAGGAGLVIGRSPGRPAGAVSCGSPRRSHFQDHDDVKGTGSRHDAPSPVSSAP